MIALLLLMALANPSPAATILSRDTSFTLQARDDLKMMKHSEYYSGMLVGIEAPTPHAQLPLLMLIAVSSTDAAVMTDALTAANAYRSLQTRTAGKISPLALTKEIQAYDFVSGSDTMLLFFPFQGRVLEAVCPLAFFQECRKILGTIAPAKPAAPGRAVASSDGSLTLRIPESLRPGSLSKRKRDQGPGAPILRLNDQDADDYALPVLLLSEVPLRPDLHYDAEDVAHVQLGHIEGGLWRHGQKGPGVESFALRPDLTAYGFTRGESTLVFVSIQGKVYRALCQTARRLQCLEAVKTLRPAGGRP